MLLYLLWCYWSGVGARVLSLLCEEYGLEPSPSYYLGTWTSPSLTGNECHWYNVLWSIVIIIVIICKRYCWLVIRIFCLSNDNKHNGKIREIVYCMVSVACSIQDENSPETVFVSLQSNINRYPFRFLKEINSPI